MYNHLLDTFIQAAEKGSFSKAAEEQYISASAVIQQMNRLESELGVKLFERSKKGIALTSAGEYLLVESKSFIARANDILRHLNALSEQTGKRILVGTNPYHMPHLLYSLWPEVYVALPDCTLSTYTFSENGTGVLSETDLIEGVLFQEPAWQEQFVFHPVKQVPLQMLVSANSPLANRRILSWKDMNEVTVVCIHQGISDATDHILDMLYEHQVQTQSVEIYTSAVIIESMAKGWPVVIPACWGKLHPESKCMDFTWTETIPYGFFLSKSASHMARKFIGMQNLSKTS